MPPGSAKARRTGARRGRARAKPVFGLGRIHLEIGDRIGAMSYGGIGVVRRLVTKLGLLRRDSPGATIQPYGNPSEEDVYPPAPGWQVWGRPGSCS